MVGVDEGGEREGERKRKAKGREDKRGRQGKGEEEQM